MASRYSDPGSIPEISSYQIAKVGHYGQGLQPVMLNFEYLNWDGCKRFNEVLKKTSID
jgi:hypothetical protein